MTKFKGNVLTSFLRSIARVVDQEGVGADESILMNEDVWGTRHFTERVRGNGVGAVSGVCVDDDTLVLQARVQRLDGLVGDGPGVLLRNGCTETAQNLAQTDAAWFAQNTCHPDWIAVVMYGSSFYLTNSRNFLKQCQRGLF